MKMPEAVNTLVVGATGRFAGLVVPALARRGVRPRGFVRTPEQADTARVNGAGEIVLGDLRDGASLKAAKADLPYNAAQKRQLAAMYANYDQHGLAGNPFTLRAILGRKPRSMREFFADLMAGTPTTIA